MNQPAKSVTLRSDSTGSIRWNATMVSADAPWVAVVIPDGDVLGRRELVGSLPRFAVPAPPK